MAGAYCKFCDRRCFVYRQVIVGGEVIWSGHMATCGKGREWDRRQLGVDCDSAHNPYAVEAPHIRRMDGDGTDYCDACDWTADDSLSDAEADASWNAAHAVDAR